jgi:hypothetical protein
MGMVDILTRGGLKVQRDDDNAFRSGNGNLRKEASRLVEEVRWIANRICARYPILLYSCRQKLFRQRVLVEIRFVDRDHLESSCAERRSIEQRRVYISGLHVARLQYDLSNRNMGWDRMGVRNERSLPTHFVAERRSRANPFYLA